MILSVEEKAKLINILMSTKQLDKELKYSLIDRIKKEPQNMEAWAVKDMQKLHYPNGNLQENHIKADNILVTVLRQLGFNKLCDEFKHVDRWYS